MPMKSVAPITTRRLELVAGTPPILALAVNDRAGLARLLQATIPPDWPPEHYDQPMVDYTAHYLAYAPNALGWLIWYILLRPAHDTARTAIGIVSFYGKPAPDGTIEIGYSLVRSAHGAGYATEAVGGLLQWAFAHPQVRRVIADTYPHLTASLRVMHKHGFQYIGTGSGEEVIRHELTRAVYEADRQASLSEAG